MDKNEQRRIWNENRGYAGKSRKWAYRRSKKAMRALSRAGVDISDRASLISEAVLVVWK